MIVIDECQRPRISSYSAHIKILSAKMRLLVLSCQLKVFISCALTLAFFQLLLDFGLRWCYWIWQEGSSADYLTFLSLLDSHNVLDDIVPLQSSSAENIGKLKERLSRYIVYEYKPESSRFKEYWVPVQMSTVQLEQYCAALISNSASLRSCQKRDLLGSLHDIVIFLRKVGLVDFCFSWMNSCMCSIHFFILSHNTCVSVCVYMVKLQYFLEIKILDVIAF